MRSKFPDPAEHAAAIVEALDGNLPLLKEMLPSFVVVWREEYGIDYCARLLAAINTPAGEA